MAYFGGKGQDGVYHTIINQMPPHLRYIEPFLGSGAIMRKKKAAYVNIGLDLDPAAIKQLVPIIKSKQSEFFFLKRDALKYLKRNLEKFGRETLIYCDPPYPRATRSCQRSRYRHEMTDRQHQDLLKVVTQLRCLVMISTYPNDLYSSWLKEWRMIEYSSVKRSGDVARENLFMNYLEPELLHDYSYIGRNASNRQDINRRIKRTIRRLMNWPNIERQKLLIGLGKKLPPEEIRIINGGH